MLVACISGPSRIKYPVVLHTKLGSFGLSLIYQPNSVRTHLFIVKVLSAKRDVKAVTAAGSKGICLAIDTTVGQLLGPLAKISFVL